MRWHVRTTAALAFVVTAGAAAAQHAAVAADARIGETIYSRCLACHALAYDRTGPRHCGLFGRRAGSVKGFAYSDARKRSSVFSVQTMLDRFIASEYANPLTLPARRPKRPQWRGPVRS